jgi:hypothetical protein
LSLVTGVWTWFKGLFGFDDTDKPAEDEKGALGYLTDMVTGVWTWFKGLFDFSSFGAGLASAAKLLFLPYTALIDLVGAIWTWFSGLFGWTDETKPKDDRTLTQKLTGLLGDVWTWFTDLFSFGKDDKPKSEKSISQILGETIDKIWAWFKDLLNIDVMGIVKSIPGASTIMSWMGIGGGDKEEAKPKPDLISTLTPQVAYEKGLKEGAEKGERGASLLPDLGKMFDLGTMMKPIRDSVTTFLNPEEAPFGLGKFTGYMRDTLLNLFPEPQAAKKGGLVGATNFPTITLPKMAEGGLVGMSPFAANTLGAGLGLESGGLFTLSQGEFVLDNQAAQTFMKAAQLLTNSQVLEQSRAGGGGPPVVINQVDNSQANPVISNQATQIKASESPHARESTKAMLDQAYAMG